MCVLTWYCHGDDSPHSRVRSSYHQQTSPGIDISCSQHLGNTLQFNLKATRLRHNIAVSRPSAFKTQLSTFQIYDVNLERPQTEVNNFEWRDQTHWLTELWRERYPEHYWYWLSATTHNHNSARKWETIQVVFERASDTGVTLYWLGKAVLEC